jgi:uncharacterized protein YqgV (UPF0045/DUF77 family)
LNDHLYLVCRVSQKLRHAHLEAATTYLDYLHWRTEAVSTTKESEHQEVLAALKQVRQAAVERLAEHLAACERCGLGRGNA